MSYVWTDIRPIARLERTGSRAVAARLFVAGTTPLSRSFPVVKRAGLASLGSAPKTASTVATRPGKPSTLTAVGAGREGEPVPAGFALSHQEAVLAGRETKWGSAPTTRTAPWGLLVGPSGAFSVGPEVLRLRNVDDRSFAFVTGRFDRSTLAFPESEGRTALLTLGASGGWCGLPPLVFLLALGPCRRCTEARRDRSSFHKGELLRTGGTGPGPKADVVLLELHRGPAIRAGIRHGYRRANAVAATLGPPSASLGDSSREISSRVVDSG